MNSEKIIESLYKRDKRILARLISVIESNQNGSESVLSVIFPMIGKAYRIGITGPPGAGKSSITNNLAKFYRADGKRVAIVAVDPTSPFTGGALLGDRVRMSEIGNDADIFIRSMATRGSVGGLNTKIKDVADLLDAAGYDYILIETVGVGQSELDVVKAADSIMVILVPESGDTVQAMKAGLMEIADFYVVNKSDRPGADQAVTSIKTMLMMREHDQSSWMPDVVKSIAIDNKGVDEIAGEIKRHHDYLLKTGKFITRRNNRLHDRIKEIVEEKIVHEIWSINHPTDIFSNYSESELQISSPYKIAEEIIKNYKTNSIKETINECRK